MPRPFFFLLSFYLTLLPIFQIWKRLGSFILFTTGLPLQVHGSLHGGMEHCFPHLYQPCPAGVSEHGRRWWILNSSHYREKFRSFQFFITTILYLHGHFFSVKKRHHLQIANQIGRVYASTVFRREEETLRESDYLPSSRLRWRQKRNERLQKERDG